VGNLLGHKPNKLAACAVTWVHVSVPGSFVEELVELQETDVLTGEEQLVTVYETDTPAETWEVVVSDEPLETPAKKKRKEEIGRQ